MSRLKPCHTSIKYLTDVYEWVLSLQISMVTPLSASTTAATRFPWPVIYICKVCCKWCCGSRSPAIADIMYRFRINAYVYQFYDLFQIHTENSSVQATLFYERLRRNWPDTQSRIQFSAALFEQWTNHTEMVKRHHKYTILKNSVRRLRDAQTTTKPGSEKNTKRISEGYSRAGRLL